MPRKPAPLTPYDRVQARRTAFAPPLSEAALCARAGLARNLLAQARATRKLSVDSLQALAGALGCTVGELLGEAPGAPPASQAAPPGPPPAGAGDPAIRLVSWAELMPSPLNPRRSFDEAALAELAESIATSGILQNLVARAVQPGAPLPSSSEAAGPAEPPSSSEAIGQPKYQIVAGERRWRAVGLLVRAGRWEAEAARIPVRVIEGGDAYALALALLENLQRQDVPPLEEAEAFARLRDMDPAVWTTETIAARIGKSVRHVQLRLELVAKLAPEVQDALRAGRIRLAQARALTAAAPAAQTKLLQKIEAGSWEARLPADQLRAEITRDLPPVAHARFDLALYTGAFVEPEAEGEPRRFADRAQFDRLQDAWIAAEAKRLGKKWARVEVVRGWFDAYRFQKSKSKGALAVICRTAGGEVEIHEGVVDRRAEEKATQAANDQARAAAQAALDAREKIFDTFAAELQAALRFRPDLAQPMLLAALIDPAWPAPGGIDLECPVPEAPDPDLAHLRALASGRPKRAGATLLGKLGAYDAANQAQILARAVAERLDVAAAGCRLTPAGLWLAAALGKAVPPELIPPAAEADDEPPDYGEPDNDGTGDGEFDDTEEAA